MDSFELNKIMGAILGTCLALLSLNIAANALFAPHTPEKPGYAVAVKEDDHKGGATSAAAPAAATNISVSISNFFIRRLSIASRSVKKPPKT